MGNIKVLWMNNGDKRLEVYIEKAHLEGLDITPCANMTECRGQLANHNHKKWEAVILNACPKMTDFEIPTETNLHSAYIQLVKDCDNIFVVKCYEDLNPVEELKAKSIAGPDGYFDIQTSSGQLFDEITIAASKSEDYRLRTEYETIYDFYMSINDSDELLIKLLKGLENDILYKDPSIPGIVRLILDGIMIYLNNENILPIKFVGSNLAKCSTWLGDKYGVAKDIVPIHVQRCFHSCVEIANNGDHQIPKESEYDYEKRISNPLYVQKQISDCKAPYLNKALIYDLLNILYWCATYKI